MALVRFGIVALFLTWADFASAQGKRIYTDDRFIYILQVDSMLSMDSTPHECRIASIAITGKDGHAIQTITTGENYPGCELPENQQFIIEDMNFDGYNDIRLLQFMPAGPNLHYYYWLYDPRTGSFRQNTELEEITSPEFDSKLKLIYSFWRSSCCHHGLSTYRYVHGRPVMVEENSLEETGDIIITTIKKRVKGQLKMISRVVEPVTGH